MSLGIAQVSQRLHELESDLITAWLKREEVRALWVPSADEFTSPHVRLLFEAAQAIPELSGDVTPLLPMRSEWRKKILAAFGDSPWFSLEYVHDVPGTLAQAEKLRQLLRLHEAASHAVLRVGVGTDPSDLANELRDAIADQETASRKKKHSTQDLFRNVLAEQKAADGVGMSMGFLTSVDVHGWNQLDVATGGIRPGHVWAFGAPTNWGKSAFLLGIADRWLAHHKEPVLYVSCEDAPDILGSRLMARRSGIPGAALRDRSLSREQQAAMNDAAGSCEAEEWLLDGRGVDVSELATAIRASMRTDGVRLVLVDYLQCIRCDRYSQDRRAQINHIARTLTDVIKTEGGAGVLASQLTDENLRESRDLEHAAEVVIIGRQEDDDGPRSLFLKKNKTGKKGLVIPLAWDDEIGCFVNWTRAERDSAELFDAGDWDNG